MFLIKNKNMVSRIFPANIVYIIGLLWLNLWSTVYSHLNVYLNLHEVMRLIGVSAELYYVRDGQINDYALNFAVPVPANINEISFTWQSLVNHPLPYNLNIITSDPLVLPPPLLNISHVGEIPLEPQTFGISMKCLGTYDAEVEITINVEIILERKTDNITDLIFRRKKICLSSTIHDVDNESTTNGLSMSDTEAISVGEHNDDEEYENAGNGRSINLGDGSESNSGKHMSIGSTVLNEFDPMLKRTVIPNSGLITLIICVVLALVLVVALLFVAYCAKGPSKRNNHGVHLIKTASFQRLPTISSTTNNSIYACPSNFTPSYATLRRSYHECEEQITESVHNRRLMEMNVQKCRVRLSSLMHEGSYGRVYRGTYNDCQDVLVKTVIPDTNRIHVNQLLQDSMTLCNIKHSNVLSVMGVSLEDFNTPFVLYAGNNNTRNLKMALQDPGYMRNISTIQTVLMASQLSSALAHLYNHGLIHKDVAARNCIVDDQSLVKLCDGALSRDLFPSDYYCLGNSDKRPIRWMSLEAIQKNHYSESSDVWAFGVLMWEICTFGKLPYSEIDPYEIDRYLKNGYRLEQPINFPDELFTIMACCWASLPLERPSFAQLQICLSEFHTQITRYI